MKYNIFEKPLKNVDSQRRYIQEISWNDFLKPKIHNAIIYES